MYLWGDLINMQTLFLRYLVILLLAVNFYVVFVVVQSEGNLPIYYVGYC